MRPACAQINLPALQHNYRLAKQLGSEKALAVIKADAYGHGAAACALALAAEADGFAVACLSEALQLRSAGITAPIVLLEGFFYADELPLCVEHNLWLVIHSQWQVDQLLQAHLERPLACWLKMDSGMHRVGFFPHEFAGVCTQLRQSGNVGQIVAITHLAQADDLKSNKTALQLAAFRSVVEPLGLPVSLSNSAAIVGWPDINNSWSRPGIMLYGSNPLLQQTEIARQLQPVMSLQSRVIALRELPAGEAVGYGGRFVTRANSCIAVIAMGYADGYPRHVGDGAPIMVAGQRAALAGRVSMDMLAADVTELTGVKVGSPVELWGEQLSVDEVARCADTVSYTLLSGIKRVAKQYTCAV